MNCIAMAAATTQQPTVLSRWSMSLPTSFIASLNPFQTTTDPNKQAADQLDNKDNGASVDINKQRSTLTVIPFDQNASGPPSPVRSAASIMFAEPDTRSTSDDGESREGSIDDGKRRSRKGDRSKTRFSVCHPPPTSAARQKMHRRPRSLLQLHKLCPNARPLPAFEVIPSANFSVRLTRAITKVFKAKHSLCPNDLVVLRAENYCTEERDEEQDARDVIGLICKGRKEEGATAAGKAKICLTSGQEWEACPLMNGGYEFFATDEHGLGLTVRWVPKRCKDKDGNVKPKEKENKRFNFSTISPNSRRHPVIASLSKTSLDVNDTYKMPDPAAATPLSTPKQGTSILTEAMEDEQGGKDQCETDDALREIITVTSIWVTFKEGWSPTLKYDDKDKDVLQRSPSVHNSPSKSGQSPVSTPPGSPSMQPLEKRTSIMSISSGIMRKGSLLSKGVRTSTVSVPEGDEGPQDLKRSDSVTKKTGRARSESTSTVLVHRAASNRRKNNQATWRPDLLNVQQKVQETSREDLNTTPPPPTAEQVHEVASPEAIPAPQDSVARPLTPSADTGSSGLLPTSSTAQAAPAPKPVRPLSPEEKRESTTTTDTTESTAPVKSAKSSKGRKSLRGGLRRLLCGSTK